jgi:hypothetical protein
MAVGYFRMYRRVSRLMYRILAYIKTAVIAPYHDRLIGVIECPSGCKLMLVL